VPTADTPVLPGEVRRENNEASRNHASKPATSCKSETDQTGSLEPPTG